jgi:hypothetical protein
MDTLVERDKHIRQSRVLGNRSERASEMKKRVDEMMEKARGSVERKKLNI